MLDTTQLKKQLQTKFSGITFSVKKTGNEVLVQPGTPKNKITFEKSQEIAEYCDNQCSFHGHACDKHDGSPTKNLLCEIYVMSNWIV